MSQEAPRRHWPLHAGLLLVWFVASFGVVFFARDLQGAIAGWPFSFWFAAQGSLLVFIAIVVIFAFFKGRGEPPEPGFDAVAFGKLFIANPDLVERFRRPAPLNTPQPDSFYAEGPAGYIDYPVLNPT